jgi:hypothetical protein
MTAETTEQSKPVGVVPRSLRCHANKCPRAADRAGFCRAHRRGLQLTASLNDAVFRFLREAEIPTDGANVERVNRAGELFGEALALLVSTQFVGEMMWTATPLQVASGRWRVRFGWAVSDDGGIDQTDDYDDTESDEFEDDKDETDEGQDDD